jgi:hypothetical protein
MSNVAKDEAELVGRLDEARIAVRSLGDYVTFTVTQDGETLASGEGPTHQILGEALHYGRIYQVNGAVTISIQKATLHTTDQNNG